jgi:hypothetical protein
MYEATKLNMYLHLTPKPPEVNQNPFFRNILSESMTSEDTD